MRFFVFIVLLLSAVLVMTSVAPVLKQLNLDSLSAGAGAIELIALFSELRKTFFRKR